MHAQAFLDSLTADPLEAENLVHVQELPARTPQVVPFPEGLPELLVSRLSLLGVDGLYAHQMEGLEALRAGRHVMLSTWCSHCHSITHNSG